MLMSGTVPVQFQHEIWKKLGLDSDMNHSLYTRVLRTSTQRHNLSYQLVNLRFWNEQPRTNADEADKTAWLNEWVEKSRPIVQHAESRLNACQRGIIFFVQKQFTADFARLLGLPCVTGDTSQADRDSIWQRWRNGEAKVVCTNKAGYYGIDHPNVAFTIHIDRPVSMLDFAQSSGRAGRNGAIALSLVLVPFKSYPSQQQQGKEETFSGVLAVKEMLRSTGCFRAKMAEFLDGAEKPETCSDLAARLGASETAWCGNCQAPIKREGRWDARITCKQMFFDVWG